MSLLMDKIDFPQWLAKERGSRGWSQSDLSRAANISRQVVSDYEGYKRKYFDEEILTKIARAFKMSPESVFRAAGLLPSQPEADEMVEKLNYKITQLTPGARALAEKLLDALLEEDKPKVTVGKTAKNTR